MKHKQVYITQDRISEYALYLKNEERAEGTVKKYIRDVKAFANFLNGGLITKEAALTWKVELKETHAVTSVNSMLAAVNGFFAFCKVHIRLKPYKIQRQMFLSYKKDLSKEEYERLLQTANSSKNEQLFYIIQTLCATGIRVGELQFITVESLQEGQAVVMNKAKTRTVFLPGDLQKSLVQYIKRRNIAAGHIFATKQGKPLNRSNVWANMKKLCTAAKVDPAKVFPHNLRSLFSRIFYNRNKDLAKLADILGHSNLNTTRVYIMESGAKHRRIIEDLGLTQLKYTKDSE